MSTRVDRLEMDDALKDPSRYSLFDNAPYEIATLIFQNLPKDDLSRVSKCSKKLYNICFPLRFKGIILNPRPSAGKNKMQKSSSVAPALLESGLLYEETCKRIRSARFEKENNWFALAVYEVTNRQSGEPASVPEVVLTGIRESLAALGRLPSLRQLSISYKIPWAVENNVYLAVIEGIAKHYPILHDNLEELELQVTKTFENSERICDYEELDQLYDQTYSTLSVANQEFLGKRVPDGTMGELVRAKMPKFPNLKSARISVNGAAGPIAAVGAICWYLKRAQVYLIISESAPRLQKLLFDTLAFDQMLTTYKFSTKYAAAANPKASLPSPLNFSDAITLKTTVFKTIQKKCLRALVARFPNLRNLFIRIYHLCKYQYDIEGPVYDNLMELRYLKKARLPWPNDGGAPLRPEILAGWVTKWRVNGLEDLEKVVFDGMQPDDPSASDLRQWTPTEIQLSFTPTNEGGTN
ncbi:hypothetical protein TWF481_000320 [Arthrobotrys musiformis]|uniref:F-box domain-containing protein n=1 Tax=Arthrobotrys musiformis TaxID=47236 RepID=A0AAV9WND3_9PEZI